MSVDSQHKITIRIIDSWRRIQAPVLMLAILAGALGTLHTLWGFKHLLFGATDFDFGGGDLKYRRAEVIAWFAGQPVYGSIRSAVYPPASYAMLWPFTGWMPADLLVWLWAVIYAAALIWLMRQVLRATSPDSVLHKVWIALIPLSMFATGRAVEVGQLIPALLPALLAGLILVSRAQARWTDDVIGAGLITLSLVKPTASIPLALIAVMVPGRWRPALLVAGMYASLTLIAAVFQPANTFELIRAWLTQQDVVPLVRTNVNLQKLLVGIGRDEWLLPIDALILLITAYWLWRHRKVDLWLLLGVTALISRMWIYHVPPDDLLILPAIVALYRVALGLRATDAVRIQAAVLCAIAWYWSLTSRLQVPPGIWRRRYDLVQALIWFAVLAFLIFEARRVRHYREGPVLPDRELVPA